MQPPSSNLCIIIDLITLLYAYLDKHFVIL